MVRMDANSMYSLLCGVKLVRNDVCDGNDGVNVTRHR